MIICDQMEIYGKLPTIKAQPLSETVYNQQQPSKPSKPSSMVVMARIDIVGYGHITKINKQWGVSRGTNHDTIRHYTNQNIHWWTVGFWGCSLVAEFQNRQQSWHNLYPRSRWQSQLRKNPVTLLDTEHDKHMTNTCTTLQNTCIPKKGA